MFKRSTIIKTLRLAEEGLEYWKCGDDPRKAHHYLTPIKEVIAKLELALQLYEVYDERSIEMKFEMNGYKIYDDDSDFIGEIYQEDIDEPFFARIEGHFTEQELVDILNKLKAANEHSDI